MCQKPAKPNQSHNIRHRSSPPFPAPCFGYSQILLKSSAPETKIKGVSQCDTVNDPILTVPERRVVLSEEFEKSDQQVEALFEELKTATGVLFDSVLEVHNGNLELFRTFLESQKAEENVEVIGRKWLLLADHYHKALSKYREFKTKLYEFEAETDKQSSKGEIPPEVYNPVTVKAIIDFSVERLTRLEKRSRQLAEMHGADFKA
jgi:hypothetical protein